MCCCLISVCASLSLSLDWRTVTNNVRGSFSARRSQLRPDTLCLRGFPCGAKPVSPLQPLSRRKEEGEKHTIVLRSEPAFKSVANWKLFIHGDGCGVSECSGFSPNPLWMHMGTSFDEILEYDTLHNTCWNVTCAVSYC